jgi:putative acetyltransferase
MSSDCEIRPTQMADMIALQALYPAAFPAEDLLPLVSVLVTQTSGVLSLAATVDGAVAGHIAFTICGISGHAQKIALLAPLAVAPAWQRQGIGGALIREGLKRLEVEGITRVLTLGDPGYYSRFGFAPDDRILAPYALPHEWQSAWQSLSLGDGMPDFRGTLQVPQVWQQPALWAP